MRKQIKIMSPSKQCTQATVIAKDVLVQVQQ